jgi:hypothetical protein
MKKRLKLILTIGLIISIQPFGQAQSGQNQEYLQRAVISDSLYSQTLGEFRQIYIQLPAAFNPDIDQKYPVAYILDGDVMLPTLSLVHDYYSGGFMPEMILIGISNANNRVRDLSTSHIDTKFGMPFNAENGEADNFTTFIEKELIPFIESEYPVTNFRTLIGHSYGGLFTINVLLKHPHLFSNYLAIDPSLDWDDQKLVKEAQEILASEKFSNKSVFMSLGGQLHMQNSNVTIDNVMQDTTDYSLSARSNIKFSELVEQNKQNGLLLKWKFYPRDLHGTIPLPSIMDGMIALFEWYQMENTDKINSFDTPRDELLGIIRYREQKLKTHFGYEEPPYPQYLLNMLGYMNMEMQQTENAKMYFELAIEYYPQSANAYDSMADYYEAQGDKVRAIEYVKKAFAISGSEFHKSRIEELNEEDNP